MRRRGMVPVRPAKEIRLQSQCPYIRLACLGILLLLLPGAGVQSNNKDGRLAASVRLFSSEQALSVTPSGAENTVSPREYTARRRRQDQVGARSPEPARVLLAVFVLMGGSLYLMQRQKGAQ